VFGPLPDYVVVGRYITSILCVFGLWAAIWWEGSPQAVWRREAVKRQKIEVTIALLWGAAVILFAIRLIIQHGR